MHFWFEQLRCSCIWRLRVWTDPYFIQLRCWIDLWYLETWLVRPLVLKFAVLLAAPPGDLFRCWQCLCLVHFFRFLQAYHQDWIMTTSWCQVLCSTSSGEGRPCLLMIRYALEEACFYFAAFIQRRYRVCCLQHIYLIRRIYCLKH